jgi:hypothetical protein
MNRVSWEQFDLHNPVQATSGGFGQSANVQQELSIHRPDLALRLARVDTPYDPYPGQGNHFFTAEMPLDHEQYAGVSAILASSNHRLAASLRYQFTACLRIELVTRSLADYLVVATQTLVSEKLPSTRKEQSM